VRTSSGGHALGGRLSSVAVLSHAPAAGSQPRCLLLLAAEVFATILGLFVFGSFKYQIHKNALTYGMALVIVATFVGSILL
jgi:hypothetical protein